MHTDKSVYEHINPKKYYREHVLQQFRPDGRKLLEYRPIALNVKALMKAEGSATLKLGDSVFICGIKPMLADKEPENYIQVKISGTTTHQNAELETEYLEEKFQLCSELIVSLFATSNILNLNSFCLVEGKLYWVLICDIVCVNYDGGLMDGVIISIISSLKSIVLPHVIWNEELKKPIINNESNWKIVINDYPISTTFGFFENSIVIADPNLKEEQLLCDSNLLTIVTINNEICLLHKHGGSQIPEDRIFPCILQAAKREKPIKQLINDVLKKINDNVD